MKLNEQEKVVDAAKEEGQKFIDARKEVLCIPDSCISAFKVLFEKNTI